MELITSQGILDLPWQTVIVDPIFVFLATWFFSGVALAWVPDQWKLLCFAGVGILLQGIIRGTSLPAFELTNSLVYLLAFAVRGFVSQRVKADSVDSRTSTNTEARRWALCCWGIVALILIAFSLRDFVSQQHTSVEVGNVRWALIVLDFFQLLRLITFLHEYGSGVEEIPTVRDYIIWTNLPLLGLIIRPSEFLPQVAQMSVSPRWSDVLNWRQIGLVFLGAVKWAVGFALAFVTESSFSPEYSWAYKVGAVFVFAPWSFYLTQAGMVDVQNFVARTWNVSLPIAWNAPFFRTNLSAFWANWNMTMTSIYRDYLFFNRWGLAQPNLFLNAMIVFTAMGIWHALNWYWLIFGLYHGLGFCGYLWFQQIKKKHGFGKWMSIWPVAFASWMFTYVFVCLGWLVPGKIVVYLQMVGGMKNER